MKKIPVNKGEEISTPWLSAAEAAVYCNMSVSNFARKATDIPKAGSIGKPIYHIKVLDEWMKNSYNISSPGPTGTDGG